MTPFDMGNPGYTSLLIKPSDRVINVPDKGKFIFIIEVIVPTLVVRVFQLSPSAISLLLPGRPSQAFGLIRPLRQEIDAVAGIKGS